MAFVLIFAMAIIPKSSGAHDYNRGDDSQLERRGVLDGITSLIVPGTNSLLGSPGGLLGSTPPSRVNPRTLPGGPRRSCTYGDAPWTVSEAAYRSFITCPGGLRGPRGVVLLVPPTGGNGREAWPKSPYAKGLPRYGFSICWVDNPTRSTGDIQLTAEFVAYAIKFLAYQTGSRISIITYSQGGVDTQWALAFWPSAHRMVRNMITLASTFRGSVDVNVNSKFIRALNVPVYGSGATALVPTTSIFSYQDEIIPQGGSVPTSGLPQARNIALQQVCGSGYLVDHFLIVDDLAAYGIALNALLNGGVANPATLSRSICNQLGSLGYQVGSLANDLRYITGAILGNTGERLGSLLKTLTTLRVPVEPPLQMYVCQRGLATGCTNGFNGPQGSASILSSIPQLIQGVGPFVGGLLGLGGGGRGLLG